MSEIAWLEGKKRFLSVLLIAVIPYLAAFGKSLVWNNHETLEIVLWPALGLVGLWCGWDTIGKKFQK